MIYCKEFKSCNENLDKKITKWLKENPTITITNICYSVSHSRLADHTDEFRGCIIFYEYDRLPR